MHEQDTIGLGTLRERPHPADNHGGMIVHADVRRLCEALTGAEPPATAADLFTVAAAHRVDVLLARRLDARDRLRAAAAQALSWERAVAALCDAAQRHGLDVLLLKGAALAYTHYPEPHLRPHNDLDLLIRRRDLDLAEAVLAGAGYTRDTEADAELWTGQRHYTKATAVGAVMVDLHWRVANPLAFAEALPFDDVWARSTPVAALGPHARTLSAEDSLLLACLHRVAHHQNSVHLLWLWDIHLLASRLPADEWTRFASRALTSKLGAVCAGSLSLARESFGTAVPEEIVAELRAAAGEPSAAFVGVGFSPFEVARADMAALTTWRARARLAGEHLFPAASYMRRRYPRCPAALLPLAYLHRIIFGAPRWLRH